MKLFGKEENDNNYKECLKKETEIVKNENASKQNVSKERKTTQCTYNARKANARNIVCKE